MPVVPLRAADSLLLVEGDGGWRLASSGTTLAAGGDIYYSDPRAPRLLTASPSTPEEAARDYVVSLSGGPPGLCSLLGMSKQGRQGCWRPIALFKFTPQPSRLVWQAAQINDMTARVEASTARVDVDLTETYLAPAGELVNRPLHDTLTLVRTGRVWRPKMPSVLYLHARGLLGKLPPPAGHALAAGRLVVSQRAVGVGGGPRGAAVFSATPSGPIMTLSLQLLTANGTITKPQTFASLQITGGTALNQITAAGDLAVHTGLVAWADRSLHGGVYARAVDEAGRPIGPAEQVDLNTRPFSAQAVGVGVGPAEPRLSFNPSLNRYLLMWTAQDARGNNVLLARALNARGRPAGALQPITPRSQPSLAASSRGWLIAVRAANGASVTALGANGAPYTSRNLPGRGLPALASSGKSDLIAWVSGPATTGPVQVRAQHLDPSCKPNGAQIAMSSQIGSHDSTSPITTLQAVATPEHFIVSWTRADDYSFNYRYIAPGALNVSPIHSYAIQPIDEFQPQEIFLPVLQLTPTDRRTWLWVLNQTPDTPATARLLAIP
jgi:hypothetical protein